MSLAMQIPKHFNVFMGFVYNTPSRGAFQNRKSAFFFILVGKHSLGTKVYMIEISN